MIDMINNSNIKDDCKTFGNIGQYTLLRPLGETHLYPVYLAECGVTKETVVVKLMDPEDDAFANESSVFSLPEYESIVRLKERLIRASVEFGSELASSENANAVDADVPQNALIMEFIENGDLFNYALQGQFPEKIARYFFDQILSAVEYLHSKQHCHLDIKLENILLDKDFCVKLSDFGCAAKVSEGRPLYNKVGTQSCRPPEMWKYSTDFKGYDGYKADIFQLGAILYILIVGSPAFVEANSKDAWYKPILSGKWETFWSLKERAGKSKKRGPKGFDSDFKLLISELLSADAATRPTIAEIRESAWFTKVQPATPKEVLSEMQKRKAKMN